MMENKKPDKKGKPEFPDIEKNIQSGSKKITEVPEPPDDIPYKKTPEEVPDITPGETDKNPGDPDTDTDPDADVTAGERKNLADAAEKMLTDDENALQHSKFDSTDADGELLNEGSGFSGGDLDVPGSEADDEDEAIGEEDEENNSFSTDNETEDRNKDME